MFTGYLTKILQTLLQKTWQKFQNTIMIQGFLYSSSAQQLKDEITSIKLQEEMSI